MISYGKQVYSGSIEVQYGVTGSLLGTASRAINATNAVSASVIPIVAGENIFINRVNDTYEISSSAVIDTGSFLVSASIDNYSLKLFNGSGSTLTTELPQPLDNGAVFSFTSSMNWIIEHNLDQTYPQVEVYEASTNSQVKPNEIISIDNNTVEVQFTVPVEGYANVSRAGNYIISTSGSVNPSGVVKILAGDNIRVSPSTGTGDVIVSFSGSAELADTAVTASYAVTASHLLGYIDPFPYTGSAGISGSLNVDGNTSTTFISFDSLSSANLKASGEIVMFGTGTGLDAGYIYYLSSTGAWVKSNADIASTGTQLLAIALGTSVSDGMLLKGNARFSGIGNYDRGTIGNPIYLSIMPGEFDLSPPSGIEDVTRVIGYTINPTQGIIYFNPSNTWTVPTDGYTV
jgi:hypothetical protein